MIENTIYSQEYKLWLTVAVLWILVFEVLLVVTASPCFSNPSLRGRRLKEKGKGSFGKGRRERNARGARGRREGNACQETIVFLVFNIYQPNVKILIGQNLIRSK